MDFDHIVDRGRRLQQVLACPGPASRYVFGLDDIARIVHTPPPSGPPSPRYRVHRGVQLRELEIGLEAPGLHGNGLGIRQCVLVLFAGNDRDLDVDGVRRHTAPGGLARASGIGPVCVIRFPFEHDRDRVLGAALQRRHAARSRAPKRCGGAVQGQARLLFPTIVGVAYPAAQKVHGDGESTTELVDPHSIPADEPDVVVTAGTRGGARLAPVLAHHPCRADVLAAGIVRGIGKELPPGPRGRHAIQSGRSRLLLRNLRGYAHIRASRAQHRVRCAPHHRQEQRPRPHHSSFGPGPRVTCGPRRGDGMLSHDVRPWGVPQEISGQVRLWLLLGSSIHHGIIIVSGRFVMSWSLLRQPSSLPRTQLHALRGRALQPIELT